LAQLLSQEALAEHETNHAQRKLCCHREPIANRIGNEVQSVRPDHNSKQQQQRYSRDVCPATYHMSQIASQQRQTQGK